MTNMAAMPIYGKNLKKIFFSGAERPMTLNIVIQHHVLEYYLVCSNDFTATFMNIKGQSHSLTLVQISRIQYF